MSKDKKTKALLPKYRFPEFESTGEWDTVALSCLAKRVTTRNKANSVKRALTNSATDGVVDQTDYFDKEVASKGNLENYFVIDEGDYVYNPRISVSAPVGPISKNKLGRGVMSPLYTVFRFNSRCNDFYEHYFKTNLWHQYMRNISNTGARHDRISISNDTFMEMPMPYHTEEEQQKIADCLTSIDDLIVAENKKLMLLQTHKKGLMQKLFPVKGQAVPQVRFRDYTNSWKQRKLGEVSTLQNGYAFKSENFSEHPTNSIVLTPGNVHIGGGYQDGKGRFFDESISVPAQYVLSPEDIFVMMTDLTPSSQTLGFPAKVPDDGRIYLLNQRLAKVASNSVDNDFLFYSLITDSYHGEIVAGASGTTVKHTSPSKILNCKLFFPVDKEEQTAIGTFFRNLDENITAQAKKIETLKLYKKGLMQGLFPSAQEVIK